MKHLAIAVALACVAATPVLAKPGAGQMQVAAAGAQLDPIGVYVDGELIGRDPDPGVRARIRANYCGKFAPVPGAK